MEIDILTKEDLHAFKEEILEAIRKLKENPPINSNEKEWLKSADVRKLLNISPGTLQNLRIIGALPYRKIGGSMYYRTSDVRRMMEGGNGNG
ncbi:helix-turn-helix domain-containing protein [Olivibacter sp. XZL3]|uniref:helix-turn-helix domain-containing protein n=1 Tax=Olivibacter sp. XZL3 TaxID=1735116 RepID=UPI0010665204|nr:helix-turn-helix domain-containing protein [Olivibacter sp. XZL3]